MGRTLWESASAGVGLVSGTDHPWILVPVLAPSFTKRWWFKSSFIFLIRNLLIGEDITWTNC